MRGRVSDPYQPLRAAHITDAPGFAGGWLPATRQTDFAAAVFIAAMARPTTRSDQARPSAA
jgi:hypothetical protein